MIMHMTRRLLVGWIASLALLFGGASRGAEGESAKRDASATKAVDGDAPIQPMQIQAEGGMRLEQEKGYGRFFGGVILVSPQDGVMMNAKELEVFFEASSGGADRAVPAKAGKEAVGAGSREGDRREKGAGDGLRRVVATGEVAIVQEKKRDDGKLERSVAKARRAVYEAATGNVTLTGWPQVKNGENVVSALSEDTVIVMNEKGVLDVQGRVKGSFVRDESALKRGEKGGSTEREQK